ncbi:hypothetical protein ABT034_23280 [Streptomyces sp. NPDC002773]|uniref:hypothetical protein n=1 Tax=Streptomyces sp. NPDC002773 TaxID=3154430 RepID=UPI00332BF8A8
MTDSGHTTGPRTDWDAARHHLLVDYGSGAHLPCHEEVAVPATVVLDVHGSVIDVDIMALPERVADALSSYAVSVRKPPKNGIALDADAAWLWLHLADGVPAQRLSGAAHVRIAFAGPDVVEVDLTLHPKTAPRPGDRR